MTRRHASPREVADVMVCALAAEIGDGDFVGVGLGTPLGLAAALLARATHAPGSALLAGGVFNADADLGAYLGGTRSLEGKALAFVSHFASMEMAERRTMTLQFLRPAQIDGAGNLNTSRIGPRAAPKVRFPGGLATADVVSLLPRVVAYHTDHRPRSLVERVDFVTGPGGRRHPAGGVSVLVTNLAVFDWGEEGVRLRSVHPWVEPRQVAEATGFRYRISEPVATTPCPDPQQLQALEQIDEAGIRVTEMPTMDLRMSSR
ncbi:MAG: hypothetical protein KatS3mg011_2355 [Acidimicrobiia bacterium]|nr:MAG: hypothetical protein KatS3mg011_2355 [Acidimicrobiia bacterium]